MAATVVSVRFDDDVMALIDRRVAEATKTAGRIVTRSEWAREVLAKAAAGDKPVQPHPARALQLQGGVKPEVTPRGCQHPVTARVRRGFAEWCTVKGCGKKVRSL